MRAFIDLEDLFASLGDALIVADITGAIILWNKAAERMFGYSQEEAMGQSLDIIIPEQLRGRHWAGYTAAMANGTARNGNTLLTVPAIDKAGRSFSIAFTIALLRAPDRRIGAIAALIRDDTQRFETERALRKQIAELGV